MPDNETVTGSQDGWNEKAGELTLSKREILPASVAEFVGNMMTGNLVIENCVAGEEPSYKATVIVGAKSEEDARKQFGKLEDVFGLDLSDTSFRFDDKDDSTSVSVVNVGGGRGGCIFLAI